MLQSRAQPRIAKVIQTHNVLNVYWRGKNGVEKLQHTKKGREEGRGIACPALHWHMAGKKGARAGKWGKALVLHDFL